MNFPKGTIDTKGHEIVFNAISNYLECAPTCLKCKTVNCLKNGCLGILVQTETKITTGQYRCNICCGMFTLKEVD